jgi:hypothetical protein
MLYNLIVNPFEILNFTYLKIFCRRSVICRILFYRRNIIHKRNIIYVSNACNSNKIRNEKKLSHIPLSYGTYSNNGRFKNECLINRPLSREAKKTCIV